MQEENRLLLKEREYYYEQNLKKLVKENEDLRLENLKLKDQIMSLKSIETLKLQELERHLYDKQN
jgi:regulator of replication initiation timing